jgi:hydroxymethylpyrimidine pyrophosphatase-like HAD family hydrolase
MIERLHALRDRYDAVLIDLDGTLLDAEGRVTPRTRDAVRALSRTGLEVVLCTGRSFVGTVPVHEHLGLDTALVAYNGGWIGRPGSPPWRYAPIPDPLLAFLAGVEAAASFTFRHQGSRKVSLVCDDPLQRRVAHWYSGAVLVEHEHELPTTDLMSVSCYFDSTAGARRGTELLDDDLRTRLRIETWHMDIFDEFVGLDLHLCEIQARSRGKAEAFAYLEQEHDITAARTIAIGDENNDLPMFERAGLAVCMGSGSEKARAAADLVIGHHARDGLAAWIEQGAPNGDGADGRDERR